MAVHTTLAEVVVVEPRRTCTLGRRFSLLQAGGVGEEGRILRSKQGQGAQGALQRQPLPAQMDSVLVTAAGEVEVLP